MKWILENATKLIGLLSLSLVIFSTVHDWGYFSIIGPNYRTLLSAYDYITNALEWMPSFVFWLMFVCACSFVLISSLEPKPREGFGDHKLKLFKRDMSRHAGFMLTISLILFGRSLFLKFPSSLEFQIVAAISFLIASMSIFLKATQLKERRLMFVMVVGLGLAAAAYITGVDEARSAIERPANVYKLYLKGNHVRSGELLRTFEKGILIWNMDSQTAELLRWDQVDGLSHIVAFDKMSPACRMVSWFCPPHAEP